jgi:hypothetical protein
VLCQFSWGTKQLEDNLSLKPVKFANLGDCDPANCYSAANLFTLGKISTDRISHHNQRLRLHLDLSCISYQKPSFLSALIVI